MKHILLKPYLVTLRVYSKPKLTGARGSPGSRLSKLYA